ncbi:MAG TPA: ABC transporter permease, partial [Blastocatellia bacterium]|nr:ABC transporter permease [Blastocatellia bacterium]
MLEWKPEIARRLANLKLEPTREAAIIEEISQHLDEYHQEMLSVGKSPDEAYLLTVQELSDKELLARELQRVERQINPEPIILGTNRRSHMIADLWQDLRYAVRMMRKAPGFTLVAVMALALGLGVNTAILSTVNGFVLRPLQVEKPHELVAPFWGRKSDPQVWGDFSYPNYVDIRNQNKSFSGLAAWSMTSAGISSSEARDTGSNGRAEIIWGETVSGNYFDVMGVKPILGRGFLPEEDRTQNTHPVVVISYSLWQRRFNSDQAIIGRTVYLNGSPFTVIGVMPESFHGSKFVLRHAFWVPLMMRSKLGMGATWETNRDWTNLYLYGRLKPSVTMAQAETDLNLIADGLAKQYPGNADT